MCASQADTTLAVEALATLAPLFDRPSAFPRAGLRGYESSLTSRLFVKAGYRQSLEATNESARIKV